MGVPAYWIVDPERRCVERWTPEATFPDIEWETVTWAPDEAAERCSLSRAELFKPI